MLGPEIPFMFQHLDDLLLYNSIQADRTIETALGAHWFAFAASGDPNEPGLLARPTRTLLLSQHVTHTVQVLGVCICR